jgi:hypothetical protein
MARRLQRQSNEFDWRTLLRRIKAGKFTPIISYRVSDHHFDEQDHIVETWAGELGYPMPDQENLPKVAQFVTSTSPDALAAKEDYIEFLKERLLNKARDAEGSDSAFLDTLEDELDELSFSDVASRLGYPHYDDPLENPLRILAELPLPIYITTNYATFMEEALKGAGKKPRTEICYWNEDIEGDIDSVFDEDPDYQPSEEEPLVFHVHGLDAFPASLVLTEDDYLDFLVSISADPDLVPKRISQALVDSSLLLIGYQLHDWDFRTIFRGLITSKRASRRMLSVSLQIDPEGTEGGNPKEIKNYFQKYFQNLNFEIYWGDPQSFMQDLWEQWES